MCDPSAAAVDITAPPACGQLSPAIVLDHAGKEYIAAGQAIHALQDCTLSISQGELFGLFGPNGAGKSTLIHLLSTLIAPTSGSATVCGYDVSLRPVQVRRNIGVLTETQRAFHGRLSARHNLEFFAALHGLPRQKAVRRTEQLLHDFGLERAADRSVQTYSSGMLQRLQMVRVLLHDPPVLLLDEPTNSMDIETADLVRHLVRDELVRKRKKTVLYTTHDLYEMDDFCDRIAILRHGRVVAQGTVRELLANQHLLQSLHLEIEPGAETTLEALRLISGIGSLQVKRHSSGRSEVDLTVRQGIAAPLTEVLDILARSHERVFRCDQPQGDGIGRLLRHYSSNSEACP